MMSGWNPKSIDANIDPMRPKEVMTSSATSRTSYSSQISRTRSKYPAGGGKQPPEFCTGSRKTAATVSGPSNSMASAIRSAAHRPKAFSSSRRCSGARYMLVFGTLNAPGTSGSNISLAPGMPVIESAPCGVPW